MKENLSLNINTDNSLVQTPLYVQVNLKTLKVKYIQSEYNLREQIVPINQIQSDPDLNSGIDPEIIYAQLIQPINDPTQLIIPESKMDLNDKISEKLDLNNSIQDLSKNEKILNNSKK